MPSSNYDYWREREELQRQHNISELDEYNARVATIYQMMIDMATQEINAFYGKYASAEGITIQEAKARISKLDIEEYARKAAEYVKNHDLSESANAEMRLYNATMKINRLELLKANIGLYMCGGFSEIEKMTGMKLDEVTMAEFERLAGILGKTINNADKRAESLVNASFQNATYSDRIWMYQDALKDKLSQLLTSGMIQGKSPAELARELRKEFDVSRHQSERLMRTELCRVQTEAQKLSYKNNGYRKYIYLALGADPCEDCLDNDGRVFNVDEMAIAVNAPPMHPNCMCSTAPYFEEKLTREEENALNRYISSGSYILNEHLRNGQSLTDDEKKWVSNLDSALKKMPTFKGNVVRVLQFHSAEDREGFINGLLNNTVINFNQYLSSSTQEGYNNLADVVLHIFSKNGRDIRKYNPEESEVLFERSALFVKVNYMIHDGKAEFWLEEINVRSI